MTRKSKAASQHCTVGEDCSQVFQYPEDKTLPLFKRSWSRHLSLANIASFAHYALSQMSASLLQTDLMLSLQCTFSLVALPENGFSLLLSNSVFQFLSLSNPGKASLTTQSKLKPLHYLQLFVSYYI